jgi:hypothetical protein
MRYLVSNPRLPIAGCNINPAHLGMTDPNAQQEELPPPRPPRPSNTHTSTAQSQLEADERYARQLAEHYNGAARRGPPSGWDGNQRPQSRRESEDEREYNFFDGITMIVLQDICCQATNDLQRR